MRFIRLFITFLSLFFSTIVFSQISHGGTPYFPEPSMLRTASNAFFIEMPSFDLDSVLRENVYNEGNMRGSYAFAHKFRTRIDIDDGIKTVLPDGTTVRQIGIRSAGAYSINLLLENFEIPPGGKLFVYNADHSYVVGSFDYRNNSPDKILPIQPVAGESIIIEYSEPADVPFHGRFIITEVNHDYRDIFKAGREPGADSGTNFTCMPDVSWEDVKNADGSYVRVGHSFIPGVFSGDVAEETIRSTVLLIINGTAACTGSLLNNASDDGKPYLLTAVHCLVGSTAEYPKDMDYYNDQAGKIITFFNYNRPVSDAKIKMKGSEELSLAGATARVIIEKNDVALFEFLDSIPPYFNPYYAGWNMDLTGGKNNYTNIHHPSAAVAKYGMTDSIGLCNDNMIGGLNGIDAKTLWKVANWLTGSTYNGSSGSPLFDENNLVIGGLTGGASICSGTVPSPDPRYRTDYFFSMGNARDQLKSYLDPQNKEIMKYSGLDPNRLNPVIRLANAGYTRGDLLITSVLDSPNNGFVFGNSNLKTLEFAEEFNINNPVEIFGTYFLLPAMQYSYTSGVTVSVYTGNFSPETKIYDTSFIPQYLSYDTITSDFSYENKTLNSVPTETFVVFDKPVSVTATKFFISYSISNSETAKFCAYNTQWGDGVHSNTAWLKDADKGWTPADAYAYQPMKTSLAIQPLVRNTKYSPVENIKVPENNSFYYERSRRVLKLKEPFITSGYLAVYSVGGQLMEKIQIHPGESTFILSERPKGIIGIVKLANNDFLYTGKIMY